MSPNRGVTMAANVSTPSTTRGPGRTKAASASTAHTGISGGRTPAATTCSASSMAPSSRYPQGATTISSGCAAITSARCPSSVRPPHRGPMLRPRRCDHVRHPVSRGERRVGPFEHGQPGRVRRATARATGSSRWRSDSTSADARSRVPVARPTVSIDDRTSSSVMGSSVRTSALHPRCVRAWSTSLMSTAHTAQRSCVTTRSGSMVRSAPSSSV